METGKTYGNSLLYKILIVLLKHIDVKFFYTFMAIFIVPITLLLSPGARLTYRYFNRIKGHGKAISLWETYRNHVIFGQTVIDKFAMYAGRKFKITYHGLEEFQKTTMRPDAMVQLSAHIGCSEILGYSYDNNKPSNVLVFGGEKEDILKYRKVAFGNSKIKMIPVGSGESHSEEIINALDNGEILCAFADWSVNSNKIIYASLHGHRIKLAKGPFSLIVSRGLDVFMTCAMKESDGSYSSYMTPLHYDKTLKKSDQRQQLVEAYVNEIERLLELYPIQWFNYTNVWDD